jgi:hypothetical protein
MRLGQAHKVKMSVFENGDSGHARRAAQEPRAAKAVVVDDRTRASFFLAYGFDATHQRGVERVLDTAVLAASSAPTELLL